MTKRSQVTKILVDPVSKRAYGVEFVKNKRRYYVLARKEVILSAGAINSPQLLMLSGIGPKNHLKSLDIPVIKDLPVGDNLQDHVALGALSYMVNDSVSIQSSRIIEHPDYIDKYINSGSSWLTVPGGTEALGFYDLKDPKNPDGYPELELLFISGTISSEATLRKNFGITESIYNTIFKSSEGQEASWYFQWYSSPRVKAILDLVIRTLFIAL